MVTRSLPSPHAHRHTSFRRKDPRRNIQGYFQWGTNPHQPSLLKNSSGQRSSYSATSKRPCKADKDEGCICTSLGQKSATEADNERSWSRVHAKHFQKFETLQYSKDSWFPIRSAGLLDQFYSRVLKWRYLHSLFPSHWLWGRRRRYWKVAGRSLDLVWGQTPSQS